MQSAHSNDNTESQKAKSVLEELNEIDEAIHAEEISLDEADVDAEELNTIASEEDSEDFDEIHRDRSSGGPPS
jgi:hypothetical protein